MQTFDNDLVMQHSYQQLVSHVAGLTVFKQGCDTTDFRYDSYEKKPKLLTVQEALEGHKCKNHFQIQKAGEHLKFGNDCAVREDILSPKPVVSP